MQSTLETALDALVITLSWPNILYPIVGTALSMLASLLPGISGITLMVVVIPITLFWNQLEITLLFGALVGGATFMGSVSAILLNIPGRASSAPTMLDGYPMSQNGEAKTAIACAASASALGSTFGIFVLVLLIPFLAPLVLLFSPLEMLALVIWGLSLIVFLIGRSPIRALIMAGLGLSVSYIGTDPYSGEPRFVFGLLELYEGPPQIVIFLGLFAVAEVLNLAHTTRQSISGQDSIDQLRGSVREGVLAIFRHFPLFLRCSTIGTVIGALPGVGSIVAGFIAYGHAAQAKDGNFGEGDIRGVLAPEAANDAKDGGALMPTLALGVPGGLGTAILLTVFTLHGITPGRDLLTNQMTLVFVLIWSLFISNWLTSIVGLAGINWFVRVTTVPSRYLVPVVLTLVANSAYGYRGQVMDVFLCFTIGLIGYLLQKSNWPRVPFIIALVLGPYFEENFNLSRQLIAIDRLEPLDHPLALIIVLVALMSPLVPLFRSRVRHAPVKDADGFPVLTLLLLLFVLGMGIQLFHLSTASALPSVVITLTFILLGYYFIREIVTSKFQYPDWQSIPVGKIGYAVAGLPVSVYLLGPVTGIALFQMVFCRRYLSYSLTLALISGLLFAVVSYLIINIFLSRSFDGGVILGGFAWVNIP